MAAHKDIRILFEVGGRRFEAVGFLEEGEQQRVSGSTMLERTSKENGGAIQKEDAEHILHLLDQLPTELEMYRLMTDHGFWDDAMHFANNGLKWNARYSSMVGRVDSNCLVLRRVE